MKTTMKQLTASTFIALLLLVGNVNAKGTESKASRNENIESSLQLENWMTDEAIWNTNTVGFTELVQETETAMELENWMTNSETWNSEFSFVEETETGMSLESWMTKEKVWNSEAMNSENELKVENWMTDNNVWK